MIEFRITEFKNYFLLFFLIGVYENIKKTHKRGLRFKSYYNSNLVFDFRCYITQKHFDSK